MTSWGKFNRLDIKMAHTHKLKKQTPLENGQKKKFKCPIKQMKNVQSHK